MNSCGKGEGAGMQNWEAAGVVQLVLTPPCAAGGEAAALPRANLDPTLCFRQLQVPAGAKPVRLLQPGISAIKPSVYLLFVFCF